MPSVSFKIKTIEIKFSPETFVHIYENGWNECVCYETYLLVQGMFKLYQQKVLI